jgi:hypothetical protein
LKGPKRDSGAEVANPGARLVVLALARQLSMTVPPAAVQASALDCSTQPWPLQEFCPLQELLAVLQELCPLQALMPRHLTPSAFAGAAVKAMLPAKIMAAAVAAKAVPEIFLTEVMDISWDLSLVSAASLTLGAGSPGSNHLCVKLIFTLLAMGWRFHARNVAKRRVGRYVGQLI